MARTWLRIRVDLLGGGGIDCDPTPGRIFLVAPSHTFEQFAKAINAAFARWDLSHLHEFNLKDGRVIGYPDDSYAPELEWLDHGKLKVAKEVKLGEEFEYVFDLGDNWRHRCSVELEKGDPLQEYGWCPMCRNRSGVGAGSPTSTAARPSTPTRKRTRTGSNTWTDLLRHSAGAGRRQRSRAA